MTPTPGVVFTGNCGAWGLSVGNPFLANLSGKRFGDRVCSFESWTDQMFCGTAVLQVKVIR